MNYYASKTSDYYENVRQDIISLIPAGGKLKILEIGAGACNTLAFLKEKNYAEEVVGVELFAIPNSMQQSEWIDKLYILDIESAIPELPKEYFDIIIFGDVLEHLLDPWAIVSQLKSCLHPKGKIVASIPNFREISVMHKVFIKGDFAYAGSGILDKTHFRFFCKKNMIELFTSVGVKVESVHEAFKRVPKRSIRGVLNTITLGIFSEFLTTQYLIVGSK